MKKIYLHIHRDGMTSSSHHTNDAALAPMERKLIDMYRDKDGLYTQPAEISVEREVWESHNRDRAAFHGFYADKETGNPHSVDWSHGRYNCGRCNMEQNKLCIFLKPSKDLPQRDGGVGPVNMESGSCEHFEGKRLGDSELKAFNMVDSDGYGVAKNGKGFGCPVCPYAEKRVEPDSAGRTLWCKFWATAVDEMACCKYNAAPVL
jgi:hypothetical protein